jgi:hypothetical protein
MLDQPGDMYRGHQQQEIHHGEDQGPQVDMLPKQLHGGGGNAPATTLLWAARV